MWLLASEELREVVRESWNVPAGAEDAATVISRKLKKLKKTLGKWEKQCFGNIEDKKRNACKNVRELELVKENILSYAQLSLLKQCRSHIRGLSEMKSCRDRARSDWIREGIEI